MPFTLKRCETTFGIYTTTSFILPHEYIQPLLHFTNNHNNNKDKNNDNHNDNHNDNEKDNHNDKQHISS
jgi:hypothetical protein